MPHDLGAWGRRHAVREIRIEPDHIGHESGLELLMNSRTTSSSLCIIHVLICVKSLKDNAILADGCSNPLIRCAQSDSRHQESICPSEMRARSNQWLTLQLRSMIFDNEYGAAVHAKFFW